MNDSLFQTLELSRIVRSYEDSFPVATGFVVKLLPVSEENGQSPFVKRANPFCKLMTCSPQGRDVCEKTFANIRNKVVEIRETASSCCFAGFTHIAVPVMLSGEQIATIYGGQLKMEKPTKRAFGKISQQLVRLGLEDHLPALEQAWFNTPVITDKQMQAILYLLESLAGQVSEYATTRILEPMGDESVEVTRARKFIQERFAEPITMPAVARRVQMTASSFSKLFKREVGLTFTEYLARVRVEKSKLQLVRSTLQIRSIAFQTGFDSISQFNRSFRQYAGMSPSEYRDSLMNGEAPAPTKG